MKAISIHPLYAAAIAYNLKQVEFRSRRTSYRGKILFCSTKADRNKKRYKDQFIFGQAIAVADLVDCRKYDPSLKPISYLLYGDRPEKYNCLILENIRPIEPIPVRGQQRIFTAPIEEEDLKYLDIDTKREPEKLEDYRFTHGYIKEKGGLVF